MASTPKIPAHVAVIMDGNGRWARRRGLPRHAGHREGVGAVRSAVETAAKRGVEYLTLFAFSSENWSRPSDEVGMLMRLFAEALRREVDELHRNDVRLRFVGDRERLSAGLIEQIEAAEALTAKNAGLRLFIAIAYGGRWDIVMAGRRLAEQVAAGEMRAEDIDEAAFASGLALAEVPDVDLLVRTGGEQRISNFLLWHLAYAELWFCDVLWPEFDEQRFDEALEYFARRQRRYGHTGEQVEAVTS
jgi:undecaprenyl diphosphate synthase